MNQTYSASTRQAIPSRDLLIALLLFIGVSLLYFATISGITSSNDGSHYALLRTMVENRTFALENFDDYAEGNDIALTPDGTLYSDRPPGTAVAAIPFYLLGGPLPDPLVPIPSRHDAENPRLPYVLMLPVFAGAGTVVLLYALLRRLRIGQGAALTAVLFFTFGTAHWKYSTVLFSHALSGFLVVASVYLVLRLTDRWDHPNWLSYFALGFVSGCAVLVEYSNALVVLIIGLFWIVVMWPLAVRRPLRTTLPWVLGGLLPAAFLAFYNATNFGSVTTLSYAYAVNYPWAGNFFSTFDWPLLPGLAALLVWGEGGGWCGGPCMNQGLLLLSPVLLLALPGVWGYFRRDRAAFFLTMGLFLVYLLLFAKHHTSHGFTHDGRYLVPFLGFLVLPLGFTLDWLLDSARRPLVRATGLFVAFGLFFLSARTMFLHIGYSFNYTLDLGALDPLVASPQNWSVLLGSVFVNSGNLLLLVLPLLLVVGLAVVGVWVARRLL